MKKRITILLLLCFSICGCQFGGPIVSEDQRRLEKIYEFPGMPQSRIYDRSLMWFAETFRSGKDVLQYQDKGNGKIIGKGVLTMGDPMYYGNMKFWVTITIETKLGRARVRFTNFIGIWPVEPFTEYPFEREHDVSIAKESIESVCSNYQSYISAKDKAW